MATEREVLKVLNLLVVTYPQFGKEQVNLSQTWKIYQQLLADIPADVLEAAALQHMASSKFFPAISELRDLALSIITPPSATAMQAWGRVTDTFGDGRYYRFEDHPVTPSFADDPILQRVVNDMGYWRLAQSEDYTADRARFLEAYTALAKRAAEDARLLAPVRELRERITVGRLAELTAGLTKKLTGG